jgi:hypothetical protein
LAERAGCPKIINTKGLSEVLRRIVTDHVFTDELRKWAEMYVEEFCAAFGDAAVKNICDFLNPIGKA